MPEFSHLTVAEFKKLAQTTTSIEQLYADYLSWLKSEDTKLQAFLSFSEKTITTTLAKLQKKPKDLPLWGVPIAVKDVILIQGETCTAASKILKDFIAPYNATVIERIYEAGGVVIGKTNLDEFAMGSSTERSAFQATKNPFDPQRVPGGSSGGSAAAVGAGLVPIALGSDTGGSIRQPAAFCNCYGLKPTYGAVSRFGLIAMASSLDQIGPFAGNLEDLILLFNIIKGFDIKDSTSVSHQASNVSRIRRVGLPKECFAELDANIKNLIIEAVDQIGVEIIEVELPSLLYSLACYYLIMPAEVSANLARYDGIRYGLRANQTALWQTYKQSRYLGLGQEVVRRVMLGTFILSHGYYDAYYLQAQKLRQYIFNDFQRALQTVDLLVLPTSPTLPFRFGEKSTDPISMYLSDIYTVSANLVGLPCLNVPIGFINNLPVGLQILGGRFEEEKIFNLAQRLASSYANF